MRDTDCEWSLFPCDGGEVSHLMRQVDWSKTACGPVEAWPRSLRIAVSTLLQSGYPMYLAWGDHFVQFYNDAYSPILADKHPEALGRTTPETWRELWPEIGPMFHQVLECGEAVTVTDHCFIMERKRFPEECYFDFSYSPLNDDSGVPGGVLVTCSETTSTVLQSRRAKLLHDLGAALQKADSVKTIYEAAIRSLEQGVYDVPFGIVFTVDGSRSTATQYGQFGLPQSCKTASTLHLQEDSPWPVKSATERRQPELGRLGNVADLSSGIGPWPEPPENIVVVPIFSVMESRPESIFVLGINARRTYDTDYREFFESVAQQIQYAFLRQHVQENALDIADKRYRAVFNAASDGLLVTTPSGEIVEANSAAETLLGKESGALEGSSLVRFFDPERTQEVSAFLSDKTRDGGYLQIHAKGVEKRSSLTEVTAESIAYGERPHLLISLRDLSERERHQAAMIYQATHDSLTDLINRYEFERRLDAVLGHVDTCSRGVYVAYLDLDQFKVVNDTCGHTAGDDLLRQLALLMRDPLAARHTLARLGGDEFGLLLVDVTACQAEETMQELLERIRSYRFHWQGVTYSVMASAGLIEITDIEKADRTDLISCVDSACYLAKQEGRDRLKIVDPDEINAVDAYRAEMQWVSEIVSALDENRLFLDRQAIVPLSHGAGPAMYEILVRMRDERGNAISPGDFIPAAERFNFMSRIDRWVFENALGKMAEGRDDDAVYTINVSGNTLSTNDFGVAVCERIGAEGVDPGRICFEITETSAISSLHNSQNFIEKVRALGCMVALDDFGSGFSSYGYFEDLSFDFIKIDGTFVRRLNESATAAAIVESITHITHKAGAMVVAEHVEHERDLSWLRTIGVDFAQGYAVGRGERWL